LPDFHPSAFKQPEPFERTKTERSRESDDFETGRSNTTKQDEEVNHEALPILGNISL